MTYDVARVRESFPALAEGAAHFDGPGGSQVPRQVGEAIGGAITAAVANRGTITRAEQRAEDTVQHARQAIADLLGADPRGVVFGRSMTQLTFDLARTLSQDWDEHSEVVVTRLDHDGNIRPWVIAAERRGAVVQWAAFDKTTGELPTEAVTELVTDRTKVVAVTGASNLLGTRPDVRAIADVAHAHGALVYVDGVHLTPHAYVDLQELGPDFFACSPYKFLGPHLGAVAASPDLLERLRPDKLLPSSDQVPERFELGTLPYELLAGVTAAVDFLADLVSGQEGSRRERLRTSLQALERYEHGLLTRLLDGLRDQPKVTVYGDPGRRTPTVLFDLEGHSPKEVHRQLAEHRVNAPGGNFYALEASRWLGLGDAGGVRAGLAPYTDDSDIDRLLEGIRSILG